MSDILVIIVTWFATYRTTRISAEFKLHSGRSFAHTLQRNGTLYFAALLVLNTLHLTFTLCSFATDSLQSISYVTHFSEPITAILVSRFLLDLQGVNQGLAGGVESTLATVGNVTFARIVAPIGSALTRDSVDTAEFEMTEDLSDDVCEKS
ncbi:hypothetical protein BD413DRAFT_163471 [Trametes elegans]|nr:hypothetical protein BD413DRAFT_163471 [Trametes elegans]